MDKITDAKTEFRLKQWSKIIQACQTSGMTVVSWCNQNNVKIKSYYYWLRKLRTLACEAGSLVPQKTEQVIVPVPFHQTKASAAVTIHISSFCVDIHDGTSRETIEAVLSALKTIC
jgi:hypothetical protein